MKIGGKLLLWFFLAGCNTTHIPIAVPSPPHRPSFNHVEYLDQCCVVDAVRCYNEENYRKLVENFSALKSYAKQLEIIVEGLQ